MSELILYGTIASLVVILYILFVHPIWNVWASRKSGEADYEQAKNYQRTQLAEATARLEAAEINKKAAVIEAEAASLQIKTIGDQRLLIHEQADLIALLKSKLQAKEEGDLCM